MSSQRRQTRVDVPDEFLERYNADCVAEALREAEKDGSTTDYETVARCPSCYSVKIRTKKSTLAKNPNQLPESRRCIECNHHFDTPAPSIQEVRGELLDKIERGAWKAGRLAGFLEGQK